MFFNVIGQDAIPIIQVPPQNNYCVLVHETANITCVTKRIIIPQNITIEAIQKWIITFSNGSELSVQSSKPDNLPFGWSIDASVGLTINNIGEEFNNATLQCIAIGSTTEVKSDNVQVTIGEEPGSFICTVDCLMTRCAIDCTDPETQFCAQITTTSLTVQNKGSIFQKVTRINSSDVDFVINGLSPNTEYNLTVTAVNCVGQREEAQTVITPNDTSLPTNLMVALVFVDKDNLSRKLQVKWMPSPESSVVTYNIWIESPGDVSCQVIVDSSSQSIEQPVDSLPVCWGGILLDYTVSIGVTYAVEELIESEVAGTVAVSIGYLSPTTHMSFASSTNDSVTLFIYCIMTATPPAPWSVGCEVCEEEGKEPCQTFAISEQSQNVSGQGTFRTVPGNEIYVYNMYAVNTNSSTHLDDCIYAQFTYTACTYSLSVSNEMTAAQAIVNTVSTETQYSKLMDSSIPTVIPASCADSLGLGVGLSVMAVLCSVVSGLMTALVMCCIMMVRRRRRRGSCGGERYVPSEAGPLYDTPQLITQMSHDTDIKVVKNTAYIQNTLTLLNTGDC